MLLSESDVNIYNADYILNEVVLLDESESITKLPAIPVVENSHIGAAVVSINDLNSIVEDYGCDYEDAFCTIAEQNEIDPNYLAVSVEDWKLIETPELINLVPNIVVKPISENNIVYQAVDYCIDEYYETNDEEYLDCLDEISDELIKKAYQNYQKKYEKAQRIGKAYYNFTDKYGVLTYVKDGKIYGKINKDIEPIDRYELDLIKKLVPLGAAKSYDGITKNEIYKRIESGIRKRDRLWDMLNTNTNKNVKNPDEFGKYLLDYYFADKKNLNDLLKRNHKNIEDRKRTSGFLSNHKKAIGLGAAGLVGAALAARKIAALRKQQQQHPSLRSKLQAIINKLKSKLRR